MSLWPIAWTNYTLPFVYKARMGVDGACVVLMKLIANHLDKSKSYVRVLLMDRSSVFNTIQHRLLIIDY